MQNHRSWIAALLSLWMAFAVSLSGANNSSNLVELNNRAFFHGREYFVLRSERAQMLLQADRADLGAAFKYLIFDVQEAQSSARKTGALNYEAQTGFENGALAVEMGGFAFTALGHRTETCWTSHKGVPAVEASWWAGGVRVTEKILALSRGGIFIRRVELEGAHLLVSENITIQAALPKGDLKAAQASLIGNYKTGRMGLAVLPGAFRIAPDAANGLLKIGPIPVGPMEKKSVDIIVAACFPSGEEASFQQCMQHFETSGCAKEMASTREQWAAVSSISTGDKTIQELMDKARFGLAGMIADDGTMNAGIFEYGAQWVRDTSNTALGALHAGQFEIASNCLSRILTKMVSKEGATMIAGGFDEPDREQFDQMGELLHLLRSYRDWTGDESFVRQHRQLLLALIERPLSPQFRDASGMVHNRREFWERTFNDAFELAYQTYVVLGLTEAAELAAALGAEDRAPRWRAEAERIKTAMLHHPTHALVHQGALIKRRNVTGEIADRIGEMKGFMPDVPASTEREHSLLPDATMALPMVFGLVDPRSAIARSTLDSLESLWNTRWSDGGYDRYNTSSQLDQPGPWTFATTFILRAQHDAGLFERSRHSLEWLNSMQGGRTGAWFEEIPSNRSQQLTCGLLPWTSGELALFVVRHYLGVNFTHEQMTIRPVLYPGSPPVSANLRYRNHRIQLTVSGSGTIRRAVVDGKKELLDKTGALCLPKTFKGGAIQIQTVGK